MVWPDSSVKVRLRGMWAPSFCSMPTPSRPGGLVVWAMAETLSSSAVTSGRIMPGGMGKRTRLPVVFLGQDHGQRSTVAHATRDGGRLAVISYLLARVEWRSVLRR